MRALGGAYNLLLFRRAETPVLGDKLSSPHITFLQNDSLPDETALQILGFEDPQRVACSRRAHHVTITESEGWKHIADGWSHQSCFHRDRVTRLRALSAFGTVFSFSMGDFDASYDFILIRDGDVARHRVVDSPSFSDRVVRLDGGDPLPGESAALFEEDATIIGFSLAESLGVGVDYTQLKLRCYSTRQPDA